MSIDHGRPGLAWLCIRVADAVLVPERNGLLSKGNREVRKPKAIKPKVIAAAPATLSPTLAPRKK